jgi:hypothetical protein
VPGAIPDGFRLEAVAVNRDRPSMTGAEEMNLPPVADIVVTADGDLTVDEFVSLAESLRG